MKIKAAQSVYFLDTISLEDELNLLNQTIEIKPKIVKNKAFGKSLQISDTKLLTPQSRKYVDLYYTAENQNSVFLTMMLLSAHPFVNFLNNFKDKISDYHTYPILDKLINLLENKQSINIDKFIPFDDCQEIKEGYSFLLKSLHQELVSNFHFEEDAWNIQKKGKAFRNIYPEYSPIVELFQGKLQEDSGELKSGHFETLKDLEILKTSNCKKLPFIILKEGSGFSNKLEAYIPSSLITEDGALIILLKDKAFEYRLEGFKELKNDDNIFENKKNIKFILFSRI